MAVVINIPQNVLFKTNDNMIYELEENVLKNTKLDRISNKYDIQKINVNSYLFEKIKAVLTNPIVDEWDSDYDLIKQEFGINIQPSTYCWLQTPKLYGDFDYKHSVKIVNILCNNEFVVFQDVNDTIFYWDKHTNTITNSGYTCKFTPNLALHPTKSLLAYSNSTREEIIVLNLKTNCINKLKLNYIITSSITAPSIVWQNDVLFIKTLHTQKYIGLSLTNYKYTVSNVTFDETLKENQQDICKMEKKGDSLLVYNKESKCYRLTNLGENFKFTYSSNIFVYSNYNQISIFYLNK